MKLGFFYQRSLNWRSFISLKAYVIIIFLVVWNVGLLYADYMGGGGLEGGLTPIGMKTAGYVYLAASIFSFSVAVSKPVQAALIAPNRAHNFSPKEFYFLAVLLGILAISGFMFPWVAHGVYPRDWATHNHNMSDMGFK